MKEFQWVCFFSLIVLVSSCHLLPNADKKYSDDNASYKLHLNPAKGSVYHYDITNETETKMEVNGTEVKNISKSNAGVSYMVNKDSSGNFIFTIKYDKLHIYTKTGDNETEADADNGRLSMNLVDRLLAILKDANLVATITPLGEIKQIKGYDDLSAQLLSTLDQNDLNARQIAQKQLDKMIGGEMIQNNLDQIFKIFPDSAVRVGDKWKINYDQKGDLNFVVTSYFKLKDITSEIVHLTSESEIKSDNSPTTMMGYAVTSNLEAKYEIESKTGMLLNSKTDSEIKGTIQLQGTEIPIKIKVSVEIEGKR